MKNYRNIIAVIFSFTISGQTLAIDLAQTTNFSPIADTLPADTPHEIILQHDFVEQFKLFDQPRFYLLSKFVRDTASKLTGPEMKATIIARDEAEAALVADTYMEYGARIKFAHAVDPDAKAVTIKIYR